MSESPAILVVRSARADVVAAAKDAARLCRWSAYDGPPTSVTAGPSPKAEHSSGRPARARLLLLRSCRPHVLADALKTVRERWRGAEITALSQPEHAAALRAQGVDHVIEVTGSRFSVRQMPPDTRRALRRSRFDVVVVPQMSEAFVGHTNLYAVALGTASPAIALFDPQSGLRVFSRTGLLAALVRHGREFLRHWFDVPLTFMLLLVGMGTARRRVASSGRRRVLHVITSWGVGGAQRQLAEVVRHCPAGTEMEILVLARVDGDFSSRHLDGHDVRIRYACGWPLMASTVREIAALCRTERYDVVHTWLFLANVLGVAGARLGRTPRVISSVRNLSLWKRTWSHRPWFRIADALASRASDVVTVNARALVRDHAKWAGIQEQRIAVVHNGLEASRLDIDREQADAALRARLHLPAEVMLVGTVGRLAPEKDHACLLAAWSTVARCMPGVHLVIVGDGPLRPSIESEVDAQRLPVTLLGEATDARQIIAGLDLFVLPSRIEGFANVLLEAAMLGVPVLATDVGAARDVIVDDQDLVPVADRESLATGILTHLRDLTGPRERAARRQAEVRNTFTVDRMVDRWFSLYGRSQR